jgi:hypothetical protein
MPPAAATHLGAAGTVAWLQREPQRLLDDERPWRDTWPGPSRTPSKGLGSCGTVKKTAAVVLHSDTNVSPELATMRSLN